MDTIDAQVAIVGAGPAGTIAAQWIAAAGLDVVIVEEHSDVGLPTHCAGLLSVDGIRRLGMEIPPKSIQNVVRGSKFYSPYGKCFLVQRRSKQAYVIDREMFDKSLAEKAVDSGAKLLLDTKAVLLKKDGKRLLLSTGGNNEIRANAVIDAEGVRASLVRNMGLRPPKRSMTLPAMQFEISNTKNIDSDFVEIYLGRNIAPGFFAWIIPTGQDTARVGLAAKAMKDTTVHELLQRFIRLPIVFQKFKKSEVEQKKAGLVLTGGPIPTTYADSFIVVGDAAGQAKPTTGGGVITGGLCAQIAGRITVKAISREDVSGRTLRNYEIKWKRILGWEFFTMLWARKCLNQLSDAQLERVFEIILKEKLNEVIEGYGDIDFQSRILFKILKNPRFILTILPSLIRALIL
ncbi:MAG: geranylgeranyl reductase family protein [Candidatus Hodarchaeota archaeon]